MENCGNCKNNHKVCEACKDGFYKSGGKCLKCSTALSGCKKCSSANVCTECEEKYLKESNTCTQCIGNCDKCDTGDTCTKCTTKHYYENK